uniref:Glycosyltransferase n=1 Tax=Oryza punctata TaxID=4537 RepID=A0A0E0JLA6_ORYPU
MAPAHAVAPHVVLLPSPGAGHVAPAAQLAARLATHHGCTATIVTHTNLTTARHSSALASLPRGVTATALPEVSLDDLPADARIETRVFAVVRRTLPHLRELLLSLLGSSPAGVTVFLTDMLCPAALALAAELGIPRYVFFTSNLLCLTSLLYTPELARTTACECRDLPEPVVLPGCVPLHGADLVDPVQDRTNPVYQLMVELGLDYLLADGFLVNTFDAMEHETLVAFKELSDKGVYPPAYAVGPFVRSPSSEGENDTCIRWLDDQQDGSVLYVCFGTGGTLSTEQTAELAAGLEASGQRFLWVVRFPSNNDKSASYFGVTHHGDAADPLSYLPEGFLERTKGAGLAVPLWAPQVEILNHRGVGGFLSHCGWNSTLEAVAAGVPMLAWPLFAEQGMNAVMLSSERVGLAALRVRPDDDGVVTREEVALAVALAVRELMARDKGAAARKKARELRAAAEVAAAPGGPQQQALEAVVGEWKGRAVEPQNVQDLGEDSEQ